MIRRRRECLSCEYRYTTYEAIEEQELVVVKRDGRRESFSKEKLLAGMTRACQKRPVSGEVLADAAERIAGEILGGFDREVPAGEIGERVMRALRGVDAVAYVRFASIYREFQEIGEFVDEVHRIVAQPLPDRRQMALIPDVEEVLARPQDS